MDHQRHAAALTDEALEREIARALAVDPSPEFLARVRTRVGNEPERNLFAALKGCATFGSTWRRASAVRWAFAVAAAALVLAAVFLNRPRAPTAIASLAARAIGETVVVPSVTPSPARGSTGSPRASLGSARPELVEGRAIGSTPLLDPRETQAIRSLIAGVRNNTVDLAPLLRPGAPAPMELPPVADLVIAPIAIEPLAPVAGAQGERQ